MPLFHSQVTGRAGALVLGGASLLALIFSCFYPATSPPLPVVEVSRSSLLLRDGRLFRAGDTVPFTGVMLETYENGSLKSRSCVSNGLLHGLSQGWYTNGVLQVTEWFSTGVSHGIRTKWHENGRKLSEVNISEGQLHGTFRRWTDQGVLSEEIEMNHGQPDGVSRSYYPTGFLKAEARLRLGQVMQSRIWNDGERPISNVSEEK